MKEGTITFAAVKALLDLKGLRKINEIHDYIIEKELYEFKEGADSLHILTTQINRKCSNSKTTEKSKELLYFCEKERIGLINNLTDLEKIECMTDEQYNYYLNHHKTTENDSDLEKRLNEVENTLGDFPDIIEKATLAEKSFENAKQSYEEELNLHAARRYWQSKRKTHAKEAEKRLDAFYWILAMTVLVLILGYIVAEPIHETIKDGKVIYDFKLGAIGFLVFVSSIGLWLSRILLKVILSNLHLQEEAREKETMIVSYLALIKDGGMEIDDRNIILGSIFRPSSNGIIKDETNVTLLDVLNIFKTKG